MSKTYRLAPRAEVDVAEIFAYIAEDNLDSALRVEQEFHDAFRLLAAKPRIGYTRPKIDPKYRFHPVYSYQIIFLPDSDPLEIVRVWHSAQRSPKL